MRPGFNGFALALLLLFPLGFSEVLPGFTGFHWVLLGFTGFYWVLLGFTGFYRVLLGFTGFYWVLLGFQKKTKGKVFAELRWKERFAAVSDTDL